MLLPTGIAHKFTTDRPTSSCRVILRNEYVTYVSADIFIGYNEYDGIVIFSF